jgi:hypothetical protein
MAGMRIEGMQSGTSVPRAIRAENSSAVSVPRNLSAVASDSAANVVNVGVDLGRFAEVALKVQSVTVDMDAQELLNRTASLLTNMSAIGRRLDVQA